MLSTRISYICMGIKQVINVSFRVCMKFIVADVTIAKLYVGEKEGCIGTAGNISLSCRAKVRNLTSTYGR